MKETFSHIPAGKVVTDQRELYSGRVIVSVMPVSKSFQRSSSSNMRGTFMGSKSDQQNLISLWRTQAFHTLSAFKFYVT
jgi:hypothetical protein